MHYRALFAFLTIVSTLQVARSAEPPRSPEEQQNLFHLPPGFEIQLVVSEPQIGQPMNLNFDARGRLWITSSVEYPYPANGEGVQPRPPRFTGIGDHAPRDWVTVLEVGPSGRGQNIQKFLTGLNIPIGQTPLGDGNEAVVYSIPNIDKAVDQNGDGIADQRTRLYGTIGNIDTHGMASSFTPWIDGWIYGCHGFTNRSEIRDGEGNVTRLTSGNTYRFRADGSRFEQFTYGQVNPFGMTFDPLGNLYDADCHTMPVYMLLRGALYPHFGSKPDALGFGPTMINHNHGSTGICGPAYYADDHFPKPFQDNLFICNPVSQVVHRDRLKQFGSTYQVDTQPDMITCDDPWFRPVDAMMGPDGCLYIADFYNPIIGHYEEPLEHPDRDRTHGRVWRVVYTGDDRSSRPLEAAPDLTKLDLPGLVQMLDHPNLLVRTMATNRLVEIHAKTAVEPLSKVLPAGTATQKAHALWALERTVGLDEAQLRNLAADTERLVRVHLVKAVAERTHWSDLDREIVQHALKDDDAFVRRAAADALGRHPRSEQVEWLLAAWQQADSADTHLIHTIRLALREHFRQAPIVDELDKYEWDPQQQQRLTAMAIASESPAATAWLVRHAERNTLTWDILRQAARQLGRTGSDSEIARLQQLAPADEPWQQLSLVLELAAAMQEAGRKPKEDQQLRGWAEELVETLGPSLAEPPGWTWYQLDGARGTGQSLWGTRQRTAEDGSSLPFLDTIVNGEQRTGVLRSAPFPLPEQISFWMCGHNAPPGTPPKVENGVVVRLAEGGKQVAQASVPRQDTAKRFTLELGEHAGRLGYLEIVDADDGDAYAWIAVRGLTAEQLPLPIDDGRGTRHDVIALIRQLSLASATPSLLEALHSRENLPPDRLAAAAALIDLGNAREALPALLQLASGEGFTRSQQIELFQQLGRLDQDEARQPLLERLKTAPADLQVELASAVSQTPAGLQALLAAIKQGHASAYVLQSPQWQQRTARLTKRSEIQEQITKLTDGLPPLESQIQGLIAKRSTHFTKASPSPEAGAKSFKKHCAACHRIGDQGNLVGPQLDGIGNRGLARVMEDVLDPSRNVDAAFRTVLIQTTDGRVISALPRREEGEVMVLADGEGKEIRVAKDEIEVQKFSPLSLMPANFGEQIPEAEFYDLMAYLMAQKAVIASGQ